jgi:uncharacterized protein YndB with AHSA1/START domain
MALTEMTAQGQTDSIAFELDLQHAPAKVWRALTDPKLLSQWLLPIVELKLEPGSAFKFNAPPQPGWDGVVDCKLIEVEAQKSLRYRWIVGEIDTVVTLTLTPTDSGSLLSVVQSGFKANQKQNFGGARYGWKMMGGKLIDLLAKLP